MLGKYFFPFSFPREVKEFHLIGNSYELIIKRELQYFVFCSYCHYLGWVWILYVVVEVFKYVSWVPTSIFFIYKLACRSVHTSFKTLHVLVVSKYTHTHIIFPYPSLHKLIYAHRDGYPFSSRVHDMAYIAMFLVIYRIILCNNFFL